MDGMDECWLAYGFCFEQLPDTDSLQRRSLPGLVVVSGSHSAGRAWRMGKLADGPFRQGASRVPWRGRTLRERCRTRTAGRWFVPSDASNFIIFTAPATPGPLPIA
jgi:hypothetical protein